MKQDYVNSKLWALKAFELCKNFDNNSTIHYTSETLANIYLIKNRVDSAITIYTNSLEIATQLKDKYKVANLKESLGACYATLMMNEKSLEASTASANAYFETGDTASHYLLKCVVGTIDIQKENKEAEIETTNQIINGYEKLSNKTSIDSFHLLAMKAKSHILKKEFETAKTALQQCKGMLAQNSNLDLKGIYFDLDLAWYLTQNIELPNADDLEKEAEMLTTSNEFYIANKIYKVLAKNETLKGNALRTAYFYTKQNDCLKELTKYKVNLAVLETTEKYETKKKNVQIKKQQQAISKKNIMILSLASIISVLALAMAYKVNITKRRHLEKQQEDDRDFQRQLFLKAEEEKKRIASDLHDTISHELLALKQAGDVNLMNQRIDNIINDVRIISRNLHPVLFDKVGLQNTIEQMAERVQQQNDILLTTDINYTKSLPVSTELQLYRIVQEAVNNMIKHANAFAGKITIGENQHEVNVLIQDNGKGFDLEQAMNNSKSFGLHNIIQRSKAIGEAAQIKSTDTGTVISFAIPKKQML